MDIAELRATVRGYFDGELSPAHDWHPIERVEGLTERLCEECDRVDERTVRLAVLLHDIGRAREDRGETIHDMELAPEADDSAVGATQYNHFYKKILDLPERMYTDAGRVIADDRRRVVEDFLDRFDREVGGEV